MSSHNDQSKSDPNGNLPAIPEREGVVESRVNRDLPCASSDHFSLDVMHDVLGWPSRREMLSPSGAGPSVYAQLAQQKVGQAIALMEKDVQVTVGVLTRDSRADSTEDPIAVVCEFKGVASEETIARTHRLAWSFCRAPLLITVEPHLVRAWSCYEVPSTDPRRMKKPVVSAKRDVTLFAVPSLSAQAAESLRWVDLVSGHFFRKYARRFQSKNRADKKLLENVREIRDRLTRGKDGLDEDTAHALLARLIFIQFLFQRTDTSGKPAMHEGKLRELLRTGILCGAYCSLAEVLRNREDAYRLFRWLNDRFNGDLFPGSGDSVDQDEAEWQTEMAAVKKYHLDLLADFVSGDLELSTGQASLWPLYSFDAIPLEFISSIYEEFVKKEKGVHYTPSHVVDLMLDSVLPWTGDRWDLRILDPACGSGIFLVKAFQRLIYRYRRAEGIRPSSKQLRSMIERNLFGVDIDHRAVRVASFSLYLAMCDAIDPRRYWTDVRFPRVRDRRVIVANFFQDDVSGLRTDVDAGTYDLVIGNAPWGKGNIDSLEQAWAERNGWPVANREKGPVFLGKAAVLCREEGYVCMLQPAGAMLFNRETTALEQRRYVFTEYQVKEIVNLSALRFKLFPSAAGPACIVTMQPTKPDNRPITYYCPKGTHTSEDGFRVVMEPHDVNVVYPHEAIGDPVLWSVLAWGGRRDLALIRRLRQWGRLQDVGSVVPREGVIRGSREKPQDAIVNRRMLETPNFPPKTFLRLAAKDMPINCDAQTDGRASTDFSAFEPAQLVVKQTWLRDTGRFQAVLVDPDPATGGLICSQSYISLHVPSESAEELEAACLVCNSLVAVYYLLLTSGRFASFLPEVRVQDLLDVPVPCCNEGVLEGIESVEQIDQRVRTLFGIGEAEWTLIEDLCSCTLPDFQGGGRSVGLRSLSRTHSGESVLESYCTYFAKVLEATFGPDTPVSTTIFRESSDDVPIRLVAIHLGWPDREPVVVVDIDSCELAERLRSLGKVLRNTTGYSDGAVYYQRVARVYDSIESGSGSVPTVYLIKPDLHRYWTRSVALRDADDVVADIMLWRENALAVEEKHSA